MVFFFFFLSSSVHTHTHTMSRFRVEVAPDIQLQCHYPKCGLDISAGELCIIEHSQAWYHLGCAAIFKENLGGAPTDLAGYNELDEHQRETVLAVFHGDGSESGTCVLCQSKTPAINIYAPYKMETCSACGYYSANWNETPTLALFVCGHPTCRKNALQSMDINSTGNYCMRCGRRSTCTQTVYRLIPHTDVARRQRMLHEHS